MAGSGIAQGLSRTSRTSRNRPIGWIRPSSRIRQSMRPRKIAVAVIGCSALAGSAALSLGGGPAVAQTMRPSPAAANIARPVVGPTARTETARTETARTETARTETSRTNTPADSSGQECFFTFPDCTSGNPTVGFTMNSDGDTTGCTFNQDTEWGDGSHDIKQYSGGSSGTVLEGFQHFYAQPGTYGISWTISASPPSCTGGAPGSLQFTLPAPPAVTCQAVQTSMPPVQTPVHLPTNSVQLNYGPTPLTFPVGTTAGNSLCTMKSGPTVMPVDLSVPHAAPIKIAGIDTTDTVEFHSAPNAAIGVPNCNFAALQALSSAEVTPPASDFTSTNNCLLTPTFHQSWDIVAKWISPGIAVTTRSAATGHEVTLYSTGPVTYYVDLATLPNFPGSSATFSQTMQAVETYIRTTLLQNIPVIDKLALFQADHDSSQVKDPLDRLVGVGSDAKVARTFPGSGYANVDGRSLAWILEPVPGTYHVTVRGKAKSKSQADFTILQLLGHGVSPLIKNIRWKALLGGGGTAASKFTEAGQAIAPVPQPHESLTHVTKGQSVTFNLHHSVISFFPAKVTWAFGDGRKVSKSPATHSYKRAGHFVPEVTVTNSLGYSATVALHEIVVSG